MKLGTSHWFGVAVAVGVGIGVGGGASNWRIHVGLNLSDVQCSVINPDLVYLPSKISAVKAVPTDLQRLFVEDAMAPVCAWLATCSPFTYNRVVRPVIRRRQMRPRVSCQRSRPINFFVNASE